VSPLLRTPVPGRDRSWREASLVALDFEATSHHTGSAEALSVGWVGIEGGRVRCAETGYTLVRHGGGPHDTIPVHGLTPALLAEAPPAAEVAARLAEAVTGRVLVAHHAPLELALLARWDLAPLGVVDTAALVRRLDARAGHAAPEGRLRDAARRHGVPPHAAHHAFGDAWATALLLISIAGDLEAQRGRCLLDDLLRLGKP